MMNLLVLGQALGFWPTYGGDGFASGIQEGTGAFDGEPVDAYMLGTSGAVEFQFSAVADVNGDGLPEVVFGSEDGKVYAYKYQNWQYQLLWSFDAGSAIWSSPAAADADGDGAKEIFFGTHGGSFYSVDGRTGSAEWSYSASSYVVSAPKVEDLDGDGEAEVVFGSYDGYTYCLDARTGGLEWRAYTGSVRSNVVAGDLDGDGLMEVVVGTTGGSVHCLSGIGGAKLWSLYSLGDGEDYTQDIWDINATDVNGDGQREVLVAVADTVYVISAFGSILRRWGGFGEMHVAPLALDVNGDGQAELIFGTYDPDSWDEAVNGQIACLSAQTGSLLWSIPLANGVDVHTRISAADLDGDGDWEVLSGMYNASYGVDSLLVIEGETGQVLWRVPLAYDTHNPFAADPDADGCVEILAGTKGDYSLHVLEDPSFSSGCFPLYQGNGEREPKGPSLKQVGGRLVLELPRGQWVEVKLFDASGRLKRVLWRGFLNGGSHVFELPKGVYVAKAGKLSAVVVR